MSSYSESRTASTRSRLSVEKGFTELKVQFDHVEKRVTTLEGFRERSEERDRALARLRAT
jgi:hypothetical protein